jgi:hypothetical protein
MTALALEWRAFRPDDATEYSYVFGSWIQSYGVTSRRRWQRQTNGDIDVGGEFQGMRLNVYFAMYDSFVRAMIERSTIVIATIPDLPPDTIIGWMAIEDGVLHYVHTKKRWRQEGVAKWMLEGVRDVPLTYSHQFAYPVRSLIGPSWNYDPMRRFPKKAA